MKKIMSFMLVSMVVWMAGLSAFAAEVEVPTDVKGTRFEDAVRVLMEKEILSGYPDGTYLPDNTINRAEACTAVVKAVDPVEAAKETTKASIFTDMDAYAWAQKYVGLAVDKGIVSGYGNNIFKPQNPVTYNEMATMLVNAMGYSAKDLGADPWPANYVNKANELGLFEDVLATDKSAAATRGDVALMMAAAVETGWGPEEEKDAEAQKKQEILDTLTFTTKKGTDVETSYWGFDDDSFFLKVPETFTEMSEEEREIFYPEAGEDLLVYADEEGTMSLVLDWADDGEKVSNSDIKQCVEDLKMLLVGLAGAEILESSLFERDGFTVGEVKSLLPALDSSVYNHMILFADKDFLRIVTFDCVEDAREEGEEIGNFIMDSIFFDVDESQWQ